MTTPVPETRPLNFDQKLADLLAEKNAEIVRLTALLPPEPAQGQVWRVGTKCGSNLYAHADGLAERGEPVGVMRSAELAAHVVQAVNAWDWESGMSDPRKASGVRRFTATDGTKVYEGVMFSMGICIIAHPDEGISRAYSVPEAAFEDLTITWIDTAEES